MIQASLKKNDKTARLLILTVSFVVFAAVVLLSKIKLEVDLGFNPHLFATANAIINSIVSFLLVWAFVAVKQKNYERHKNIMLAAMLLSVLFLLSYIAHHLFNGETMCGGALKSIYYFILLTHIPLAAIILPLHPVYRIPWPDCGIWRTS
ncbi:MAG: DUF420 domain-containing protein [Chitinophagaceae bacterium]